MLMDVVLIMRRLVIIQRRHGTGNFADLDRGTPGGVGLSPNDKRLCGVVPQSRPNGVVAGAGFEPATSGL